MCMYQLAVGLVFELNHYSCIYIYMYPYSFFCIVAVTLLSLYYIILYNHK